MLFIKYPEEPGCRSYVVPFFSLVDAILNNRREVINLFIGDFV